MPATADQAAPQSTDDQKPPAAPNGEPELLSVDDLMGEDTAMPEVKQHAIDAARASHPAPPAPALQPATAGSAVKGQTDDLGRAFDPALHVVGEDGKAVMNAKGFIAKKRGRAGAAGGQSKVNTKAKDAKPSAVPENVEAQIHATAEVSTHLFLTMAQMIGGEEFAPIVDAKTGENEPAAIQSSFAAYYRAKGIIDIPPGAALAIGLSFYVVKRWNQPKFTEKREVWFGGIRRWWADFRFRRTLAKEAKQKAATVVDDADATNAAADETKLVTRY